MPQRAAAGRQRPRRGAHPSFLVHQRWRAGHSTRLRRLSASPSASTGTSAAPWRSATRTKPAGRRRGRGAGAGRFGGGAWWWAGVLQAPRRDRPRVCVTAHAHNAAPHPPHQPRPPRTAAPRPLQPSNAHPCAGCTPQTPCAGAGGWSGTSRPGRLRGAGRGCGARRAGVSAASECSGAAALPHRPARHGAACGPAVQVASRGRPRGARAPTAAAAGAPGQMSTAPRCASVCSKVRRDTMRTPSHSTMSRSSGTTTQTEAVSTVGRTATRRRNAGSSGR